MSSKLNTEKDSDVALCNSHVESSKTRDLLETIVVEDSPQYPPPPPRQHLIAAKKRKYCISPSEAQNTITKNRFNALPLDPMDERSTADRPKPSKPPPIVLNGIEDDTDLSKLLQAAAKKILHSS